MRELTADEEMVAESDVTDPERPAGVDYSPSHFLRRKFRRKAVV